MIDTQLCDGIYISTVTDSRHNCWQGLLITEDFTLEQDNSVQLTQLSCNYYTFKNHFMVSFVVLMIIISRIDVMHKQFFDFFLFIYFSLICFIYIFT